MRFPTFCIVHVLDPGLDLGLIRGDTTERVIIAPAVEVATELAVVLVTIVTNIETLVCIPAGAEVVALKSITDIAVEATVEVAAESGVEVTVARDIIIARRTEVEGVRDIRMIQKIDPIPDPVPDLTPHLEIRGVVVDLIIKGIDMTG